MSDMKLVRFFRQSNGVTITSHIYNLLRNEWQLPNQFVCELYVADCACYVVHGDYFYVFDDGRHEEHSRGARINLRTGETTRIEHPKLYFMELIVVDNVIYALGFYGSKETERIVLRFLFESNIWSVVSRTMKYFWREGCAVASQDKFIYVAGGKDAWHKQSSLVECFDKSTRKWTELPNMNRKRCYFILTIIDGFMYAIDRKITTAERYDFELGLWEHVSISGRKAKMYFSAVTVQDRLYAIEVTNGEFYRIDLDANGKKLRLVSYQANGLLGIGHYELHKS